MFSNIKAKEIDIRHLTINYLDDRDVLCKMFYGCKSKIIASDNIYMEQYEKDAKELKEHIENKGVVFLNHKNSDNTYMIHDGNNENSNLSLNEIKRLISSGVICLNFELSEDKQSIVLKKNPNRNKDYALLVNWSPSDITLISKKTGEIKYYSYSELSAIISNISVDNIEVDANGKITTMIGTKITDYAINPEVDYRIFRFLNHYIFEMDDHPDATRDAIRCAINEKDFKTSSGGSAYDDAMGLYSEYKAIKKIFKSEDLRAVFEIKENNKFTNIYKEMKKYDRSNYKAPDSLFEKILKLSGLPKWCMEYIKNDLYVLSD